MVRHVPAHNGRKEASIAIHVFLVYFSEAYFVISFLAAPATPLAVKKIKAKQNPKFLLSISKPMFRSAHNPSLRCSAAVHFGFQLFLPTNAASTLL